MAAAVPYSAGRCQPNQPAAMNAPNSTNVPKSVSGSSGPNSVGAKNPIAATSPVAIHANGLRRRRKARTRIGRSGPDSSKPASGGGLFGSGGAGGKRRLRKPPLGWLGRCLGGLELVVGQLAARGHPRAAAGLGARRWRGRWMGWTSAADCTVSAR